MTTWRPELILNSAKFILALAIVLAMAGCSSLPEDRAGASADESEVAGDDPSIMSFFPDDIAPQGTSQPVAPSRDRNFPLAKWEENPRMALGKAESLKRPLLIMFTAMSWNENSTALSKEVFVSRTFNEFARENLVLTFLDFPQNITESPEAYRKFKDYYEVSGYPTVLLIDPKTKVDFFREVGYTPGKARDYYTKLRASALRFRDKPVTDWEAEEAAANEMGPPLEVSEPDPLTTE